MTLNKSKKNTIIKRVRLAVAVLVFAVLQNTAGWFLQIGGARALILIPLVTAIAMFERDVVGVIFGLFAGALWDISAGGNNFNMIFFVITGFACGTLIKTIMRNNFITHLILTGAATLIYCTGYWVVHYVVAGVDGAFVPFAQYYLTSFIYTIILTPPVFFMVRAIERKSGEN